MERLGTAIGPLGDVLKSAKSEGANIIRAKLVRGETGKRRVKLLYIHPVRGVWQQIWLSNLLPRFPSRPFPRSSREESAGLKIWLDDMRPAPDGWRWVRTVEEAIELMSSGEVVEASLDHDLGDGDRKSVV